METVKYWRVLRKVWHGIDLWAALIRNTFSKGLNQCCHANLSYQTRDEGNKSNNYYRLGRVFVFHVTFQQKYAQDAQKKMV